MADFHRLITDWYRLNKRDLPWRNTTNPYFIWLSEIILQQTRVMQGLNYYLKFVNNYPTVFDLANASEEQVLNDWQGLGYYSRARNLHATSKMIVNDYGGSFPDDFNKIKSLKGVGDYTAAAISSFAFDLPYSVVDGNVYRVLSRVYDVSIPIDSNEGKKYFSSLAQELLSISDPATHNQAIMEIGAIQCLPVNPLCESCPLNAICLSLSRGVISDRPVKSKKNKTRNRFFHFLIFKKKEQVIIEKRIGKDIWQHLYQFPLVEIDSDRSLTNIDFSEFGVVPFDFSENIKHVLSHQKINARFYYFDSFPISISDNYLVIDKKNIQDYPMPRLMDRFLENEIE